MAHVLDDREDAKRQRPAELRPTSALLKHVEELHRLDTLLARRREQLAQLDEERDRLRRRLARWINPGFWRIGRFTVRRTVVEPMPSIDAWAAIQDGQVPEETLRPYMRDRSPFERWTLKPDREKR